MEAKSEHSRYPADNSLNIVRLGLAVLVIYAHAFYIVGAGTGPNVHGENLGGFAVFGFFAVSGYLVTHSRITRPLGVYLVHRLARLLPAFWVCLLVMVGLFGPVGYLLERGTLDGYLTSVTNPLNYVFSNMFLRVSAYDIAGTPSSVPFPGVWNGSIWTLYYEFVCYMILAGYVSVRLVRRYAWQSMLLLWVGLSLAYALWPHGLDVLAGGNHELGTLLKLSAVFMGGALLRLLPWRIRYRPLPALAAAVCWTAIVWFGGSAGPQFGAPLLAYVLLTVGLYLPRVNWLQKHDFSYGVYIFAFPVQQLIVMLGVGSANVWIHSATALALTAPLAIASWFLVERPVMRRARAAGRSGGLPAVGLAGDVTSRGSVQASVASPEPSSGERAIGPA